MPEPPRGYITSMAHEALRVYSITAIMTHLDDSITISSWPCDEQEGFQNKSFKFRDLQGRNSYFCYPYFLILKHGIAKSVSKLSFPNKPKGIRFQFQAFNSRGPKKNLPFERQFSIPIQKQITYEAPYCLDT